MVWHEGRFIRNVEYSGRRGSQVTEKSSIEGKGKKWGKVVGRILGSQLRKTVVGVKEGKWKNRMAKWQGRT